MPGLGRPRKVLEDLTFSLKVILVGHPGSRPWFNVCLVSIPLAIIARALLLPHSIVFILSLLSMLPLAERLGFCTEELSEHVNDTVAGLMNASMGNAPELIIALFAMYSGKIEVVKQSLIGSVLSNLLLVLGSALVMGGTRVHMQAFNNVLSPQNASLLLACCLAVFLPTTLVASGLESRPGAALLVSRVASLLLLLLYVAYLVFQLKTHAELFEDEEEGGREEEKGADEGTPLTVAATASAAEAGAAGASVDVDADADADVDAGAPPAPLGAPPQDEHLTMLGSTFGLAITAALVAYVSEILVGAIEGASSAWGISAAFVAAILLPIAGNAAEHTSALIFAYKDRLDLALGICVGSAVQIYAFVLPLVVVLGWMVGQPMSLDFKPFEFGMLLFSVLLTAFTLLPSKTTYLSGCIHIVSYIIVATGYLLYSGSCPAGMVEEQSSTAGLLCKLANATASH
jgi:Ca2+:H+ antiporter